MIESLAVQGYEALVDPGSFVDPREWGTPPGYYITSDRDQFGNLPPIIRSEADLRMIRSAARFITDTNPWLAGLKEDLTNYVIGQGAVVNIGARKKNEAPQPLIEAIQDFVDELLDDNDWYGDRDRESFTRQHRDGQSFVRLFPQDRGATCIIRFVEPEYVTQPAGARRLEDWLREQYPDVCDWSEEMDWSYGIQTAKRDVEKHLGYFVKYGTGTDWDYVPESVMVYGRRNVDRTVKPGLSDYFCVQPLADEALRLLRSTIKGSRKQALYALITEYEQGAKPAEVTEMLAGRPAAVRAAQTTPEGRYQGEDEPIIYHAPQGRKVQAGPLGNAHSPIFNEVCQFALRAVGARWSAPEFMVSSDASNGNYASSMVAESPFIKNVQSAQYKHGQQTRSLIFKAMYLAWLAGRFRGVASQIASFGELKRAIVVDVQGPQAETRDKMAETERRLKLMAEGVMLPEQVAAEEGIDWTEDHEVAFAEKKQQALSLPGVGGFASAPQAGGPPAPAAPALQLNGAQITAASGIVQQLSSGLSESAARELLMSLGLKPEAVDAILSEKVTLPAPGKTPTPDDIAEANGDAQKEALKGRVSVSERAWELMDEMFPAPSRTWEAAHS